MVKSTFVMAVGASVASAANHSQHLLVDLGATTYPVKHETIVANGLVSGGTQDALLYYPDGDACGTGGCPLLSFAHGTGVAPASYDALLTQVASYGYIIVAIGSCPFAECTNEYLDQLHAIDAVQDGTATNKPDDGQPIAALKGASFKKVGIFGHSMGGGATCCSASVGGHGIAAGVALHPSGSPYCPSGDSPRAPMLFMGGTKDTLTPSKSVVYPHYKNAPSPKAYINVAGATHTETLNDKPYMEGLWTARWFDCHLKVSSDVCDYYFADSTTGLCGSSPAYPIKANRDECYVEGLGTVVV